MPARSVEAVSVYIIECGGRLKIGISSDPARRLSGVQTGASDEARIVSTRTFPDRTMARRIESLLHWRFRRHHLRGEWFNVPVRNAVMALRSARIPGETIADVLFEREGVIE